MNGSLGATTGFLLRLHAARRLSAACHPAIVHHFTVSPPILGLASLLLALTYLPLPGGPLERPGRTALARRGIPPRDLRQPERHPVGYHARRPALALRQCRL